MPVTVKDVRQNLGPGVRAREPLAPHTNFKIGGPARFFFTATTTSELVKAAQVAQELKIPFLALGSGSNVLVSDKGFPGLVVEVRSNQLKVEGTTVIAEAGVKLAYLVQQAVSANLTGLEPLVAVPGTVGGAVYGNAGVPQVPRGCIGDFVREVVAYREDKVVTLAKADCKFSYRDSLFKHNHDVILSATLQLERGEATKSQELVKRYIDSRKHQPYHQPSSGCVFTNVPIANSDEVRAKFAGEPKLEEFLSRGQLPASWLIDQAGLKGKVIGNIQVSDKHANYLVNLGNGKAEQVVMLISLIKQQVRDKFGIQLQEEVRYLGF